MNIWTCVSFGLLWSKTKQLVLVLYCLEVWGLKTAACLGQTSWSVSPYLVRETKERPTEVTPPPPTPSTLPVNMALINQRVTDLVSSVNRKWCWTKCWSEVRTSRLDWSVHTINFLSTLWHSSIVGKVVVETFHWNILMTQFLWILSDLLCSAFILPRGRHV